MNSRRSISVLIPMYNRSAYIAQCLSSVLNQRYENFEVIVSDNCSTDGSPEIVRSIATGDKRVRLIENSTNIGPLGNWRRCIQAARNEFIHFLWSDDYIVGELYSRWNELNPNGHQVIGCASSIVNDDGHGVDLPPVYSGHYTWTEVLRHVCGTSSLVNVSTAAYILPRESALRHFYDSVPKWRDIDCAGRAIGPDWLLTLGAIMDTGNLVSLPERYLNSRAHGGSITVGAQGQTRRHYAHALAWFMRVNQVSIPFHSKIGLIRKALAHRDATILRAIV